MGSSPAGLQPAAWAANVEAGGDIVIGAGNKVGVVVGKYVGVRAEVGVGVGTEKK